MRNIIYFFVGIALLGLTFASVFLSGVLFDAAGDARVVGFVFQPNNLSERRVGKITPLEELSDKFVRERLITKFMHEYFYVIPDVGDINRRKGRYSVLSAMSDPDIFSDWQKNVAPELERMAEERVLRRVIVHDILKPGEYYVVNYDLITWDRPNIIGAAPATTSGVMYLQIRTVFEEGQSKSDIGNGVRDTINGEPLNVREFLRKGGDPAAIFMFKVSKVIKQ